MGRPMELQLSSKMVEAVSRGKVIGRSLSPNRMLCAILHFNFQLNSPRSWSNGMQKSGKTKRSFME